MALWTIILRKMAKNKWLQVNLWFGLTVCVALFSSMPLYSHAIMQRTLIKELQQVQAERAVYPGYVRIGTTNSAERGDEAAKKAIANADRFAQTIPARTELAEQSSYRMRATRR